MNKVGVWGNFGKESATNGQSIKVRYLYSYIEGAYPQTTFKVDSSNWKRKPFTTLFKTIKMMLNCKTIIILPANNGLKVLSFLFILLRPFYGKRKKIIFITIGTSLPKTAGKSRLILKFLKTNNVILCEGRDQKRALNSLNLSNVVELKNFRPSNLIVQGPKEANYDSTIFLCTFSRVTKDKGILDAIRAVKMANSKTGDSNIFLDIYGPIDESFKEEFMAEINNCEFLNWKGVAKFDEASKVISKYFCLLFPTYYSGEGHPGTIIDSLFAGVPIIATKWNVNYELVNDKTGFLVDIKSPSQISEAILKLYNNRNIQLYLANNCLVAAEEYTSEKVLSVLKKHL